MTQVGMLSLIFHYDLDYPLKFGLSSKEQKGAALTSEARSDEMAYDPLPYSKNVEKHILECIQGGVGIREMLASMQHLQGAPKSLSTLYKIYGTVIHSERARINAAVGKKVIDQALEGDFKSQELFLRSKGGWSPKETIETTEGIDEDTDESAVNALMTLLGFSDDPDSEEDNR
jgi:hypothetical protein